MSELVRAGVSFGVLTKSQPDQIEALLSDASYVQGGYAACAVFPESVADVAEVLAKATRERTPVTISGAGTGTVAGRVPFGGIILATDRLNRIGNILQEDE